MQGQGGQVATRLGQGREGRTGKWQVAGGEAFRAGRCTGWPLTTTLGE